MPLEDKWTGLLCPRLLFNLPPGFEGLNEQRMCKAPEGGTHSTRESPHNLHPLTKGGTYCSVSHRSQDLSSILSA